jgi:predicted nuclease of predicted toxin-antitoxin system
MRFLLDQDVYASTARFLKELGHDVLLVGELGLGRAEDEELLTVAQDQRRIFVTRDRDFGHLVFVRRLGAGVLYLRILPSNRNAVHSELDKVIRIYAEEELAKTFVVIEPAGHRMRRPSSTGE